MKKVVVTIFAILCIAVMCGGFYYVTQIRDSPKKEVELTEVQKLNTKNIENDYPETPREVVKLFNRILVCYYKEEFQNGELETLTEQARLLMDADLLEKNTKESYLQSVKADIAKYKEEDKTISQTNVGESSSVKYITDNGDELAYVDASYFIKTGNDFERTYEKYVLRKNPDGNWKILVFYQIEGDSSRDED